MLNSGSGKMLLFLFVLKFIRMETYACLYVLDSGCFSLFWWGKNDAEKSTNLSIVICDTPYYHLVSLA